MLQDDWQPLAPGDVGVADDQDRLLEAFRESGPLACTGLVRVVPEHRFFFEHPLDHLPGTYLLEVGRQLGVVAHRRRGESRATLPRRFRVSFGAFAEKEGRLEVTARLAPGAAPDEVEIEFGARQRETLLGEATSAWALSPGPGRAPFDPDRRPSGAVNEVTRDLVHKRDAENVFVEWIAREAPDRFLGRLVARLDHSYFRPRAEGSLGGLYLIESARQLAEAASHLHFGVPRDHAFAIDSIGIAHVEPARLGEPVLMGARVLEASRRRLHFAFELRQGERSVLVGDGSWCAVPPRLYRRLRGRAA